jgi:hypothetical protein
MSWEQLELMAAAHSKIRARQILKLGQMVGGDDEAFKSVQNELIKIINEK